MYRKSYCNERTMIGKAGQNQIVFTFVTGETVKIQAGDIDPLTGEKIPDEIFAEYHKLRTSEVHRTLKTERVPFTEKELDVRRKEREEIAKEFEETYGYRPTKDNIRFIQQERCGSRGNRYNLHTDALVETDGESDADQVYGSVAAVDGDDLPGHKKSDVDILREFAATLTGRMRAVYEMMLEKHSGGAGAKLSKDLAVEWGVSQATIVKDQKRIEKMIVAWFAEKRGGQ